MDTRLPLGTSIRMRAGAGLPERSLALVAEMAERHDFQVWLEKAEIGGRVGILMEDGAVVAVDGEPRAVDAEPALSGR